MQNFVSSLFSVFILSTILTVTEIYIFLAQEEKVAEGIKNLATSSIDAEDAPHLVHLVNFDLLDRFSSGEEARQGYKQYAYCLIIALTLITIILYVMGKNTIDAQLQYIAVFIVLSVLILVPFQIAFNEKVISKTEVITADDVKRIINEECTKQYNQMNDK